MFRIRFLRSPAAGTGGATPALYADNELARGATRLVTEHTATGRSPRSTPTSPGRRGTRSATGQRFAYGGCGIRYVRVLDYIAGSTQARLSRLPVSDPTPSITLGFDGWFLPK